MITESDVDLRDNEDLLDSDVEVGKNHENAADRVKDHKAQSEGLKEKFVKSTTANHPLTFRRSTNIANPAAHENLVAEGDALLKLDEKAAADASEIFHVFGPMRVKIRKIHRDNCKAMKVRASELAGIVNDFHEKIDRGVFGAIEQSVSDLGRVQAEGHVEEEITRDLIKGGITSAEEALTVANQALERVAAVEEDVNAL